MRLLPFLFSLLVSLSFPVEPPAFSQSIEGLEKNKALEIGAANAKLHDSKPHEYNPWLDRLVLDPHHSHTFSSRDWKSHEKDRSRMVTDLVWSNSLIGMKKQAVYDLLGQSEWQTAPVETYLLFSSGCGNGYFTFLDVHYKNDVVEGLQIRDNTDGISQLFITNPAEKLK